MTDPKYPVERADLTRLPWRALEVVAKVIESGDRKYAAGDWIMAPERIDGRRDLASALRHVGQYIEGQETDEDSGLSPLAHAAARLLFLLEREERGIKGGGWRIGQPSSPRAGEILQIPSHYVICGTWFGNPSGGATLCTLREGHFGPHEQRLDR